MLTCTQAKMHWHWQLKVVAWRETACSLLCPESRPTKKDKKNLNKIKMRVAREIPFYLK